MVAKLAMTIMTKDMLLMMLMMTKTDRDGNEKR
jgi:hypothetical protein